jgi:NDP-sugar pyrophosphorylase family protein
MKAMIFAAGLGTRMRPLTDTIPKALITVNGISLLEINIRRLVAAGFTDIVVNVHHHAEQIELFIMENAERLGANIVTSDERELLLDTGGGLQEAAWFFDDNKPFLVGNADILSNIDLKKLYQAHLNDPEALATFAVQQRETSRYMLFDDKMTLHGWLNTKTKAVKTPRLGATHLAMYSFSCFQVLSPEVLRLMPNKKVFSMIDIYLHLCPSRTVRGYLHPADLWCDVGKPEALTEAAALVQQLNF